MLERRGGGKACVCVPHLRRGVGTRGDNVAAISAEGGAIQPLAMEECDEKGLACIRVPDASRLVSACGDNAVAIRAKDRRPQRTAVLDGRRKSGLAGIEIHDTSGTVFTCGNNTASFRAEPSAFYWARVSDCQQLFTADRMPNRGCVVPARCGSIAPIGAERDLKYLSRVLQ